MHGSCLPTVTAVLALTLALVQSPRAVAQDACSAEPTFAAFNCRLDELTAQTMSGVDPGSLRDRLLSQLERAKAKTERAEVRCADGDTRRAL